MARFRWLRRVSCADVDLQRLVEQPRCCQLRITFLPLSHKRLVGDAVPQVLVLSSVIPHTHPRNRISASVGRIVMSRPNFHMVREAQQLLPRTEQVVCTSPWKITPRSADVDVEDGVSTEHVVCEP